MVNFMKEDHKTTKPPVHELAELRPHNTALKKSMTGSISAELAAEEASRYAESIVETIREPLLVLDADLKIISANRTFYRTFRVTPGNTIGSFIYTLGNKQWDIPKLRELLEEILPKNETFDDFEVVHDFRDIGCKIMLLNTRRIYRKDIGAQMILLAIEDITERKKVEKNLTATEAKYQELVQNANSIILRMDPSGKILFFNEFAQKFFGYTEKEMLGRTVVGTIVPKTEPSGRDFDSMIKDIGTNPESYINNENENIRRNGERIWVAWTNRAIRDEFGNVTEILCIGNDITEHKRLENLLMESEERYRRLFETASDGIVLLEKREGKITHANPATEKMVGYTKKESIGHKLRDIGVLLDMGDFQMLMQNLNRSGIINYNDVLIETKTGQHIRADIYLVDRATLVQCNIRDITDRKQAEEELRQTLERLRQAVGATIQVLVSAVEARDPYTAGHQSRSAALAGAIAAEMGLSQEKIEGIRIAGSIHDIGKLSIPAEILSKPTKLSKSEFSLIKEHARHGYEILKEVKSPWALAEIVYQHHERMDGSGYPRNLKGNDILMEARIMAVADVVESMASYRPYRPALGIEAALNEIEKNRGIMYDDAVVDTCLRLFREKGFKLAEA
jgi:PAS domain S-box-containing protein/putative nucleotidyltransferase with HDIG domain